MTDMLERSLPLEDRIYARFKSEKVFTSQNVIDFFEGRENTQSIYRAIKKLTADGRIKFHGYVDRKKVYSSRGDSDLPYFKNVNGDSYPLSAMLLSIDKGAFDNDYHWKRALSLDALMPLLCRLFVIAQFEDNKDMEKAFNNTVHDLNEIRTTLTWMLSLINDVYRHPSMKGNPALFKATFNGNDEAMPTAQQINEFKVWYQEFMKAHNNGE